MATTASVSNIVIEPVDLRWGNQHLVCFDTVEASGLAGDYAEVSSQTVDYYVWFDDGVAADPAVAGKTGIAVTIVGTETAVAVAGLIATAINAGSATTGLHAKAITDEAKVLIEVKDLGAPKSAFAAGTSGFTATVLKEGSELALGYLDSNVEFALGNTKFDVTSHQTGTEVIAALITGSEVGPITVTMKETVAAKLKEIMTTVGQTYTPAGGTEVFGVGALAGSKQFSNAIADSKMLIMHPTKLPVDDYSQDYCFWSAWPNLNNLVISGEEDRKAEVEFSIYLDETRVNEVKKAVILSDWTQNFLKG